MVSLRLSLWILSIFLTGCLNRAAASLEVASQNTPPTALSKSEVSSQEPAPDLKIIKAEQETLGSAELDEALRLTDEGRRFYLDGRYDSAERVLKDALLLYPFIPEARLLLAKVLLVRGAAGRDLATLKLAKLMLEMALAMQPDLQEATQLLELFEQNSQCRRWLFSRKALVLLTTSILVFRKSSL